MPISTPSPSLSSIDQEVLRPLGTGAGSTILLVRDKATSRRFALKVVRRQGPEDEIYINQVLHEWQVIRLLDHPSIIKAYDCRVRKSWFRVSGVELLMEFIDGSTLDNVGPLSIPKSVAVFRRVADAMAHMHRRGVYHGDLKPGNLMLARSGEVKVIDFGTAWIRGQDKQRIQGTPYYMAPEQAEDRVVNEKTDIYNFGATMYRVFTGEYANLGLPGQENGRLRARMKTPAMLVHEVPSSLSELIMSCIAQSPEKRPSGMAPIRRQLDQIASELGPEANYPLDLDDED